MSHSPERPSCQVTMAPPEPSEVMVGEPAPEPAMLRRATPLAVHCGTPVEFTLCAQMPPAPGRPSSQVTMAPPEPSEVIVGEPAPEPAMFRRATPLAVHCGVPEEFTL